MVDAELLFAIGARLGGRSIAHRTERKCDCSRWRAGQRWGVDKYVWCIRGRDTRGWGVAAGRVGGK